MSRISGFHLFAFCAISTALIVPAHGQDLGEILFTPQVLDRGSDCVVGFSITYPQNTLPHSRHVRVTTQWSTNVVDYAMPIPPHGAPDRFKSNADSTITFTGTVNETIAGCDPELTARTLAIGGCAQGVCTPARFVPNDNAVRFGLNEAEY
jgi:hypothetical protein